MEKYYLVYHVSGKLVQLAGVTSHKDKALDLGYLVEELPGKFETKKEAEEYAIRSASFELDKPLYK